MALTSSSINARLTAVFKDIHLLNAECKQLALDIQENAVHLVNVIEGLEPFITSNEKDVINQSIHAISQILSHLPYNFLSDTEIKLLLTFYNERLNDHYSFIPATLTGILYLLKMDNLSSESIKNIFTTMFSQIQCQSLQRSERNTIFLILKYVLYNKVKELKEFENEFVCGVMCAIDGERDPRNLLLIFEILPILLKNFTLGNQREDIFEIIACYFPVDYTPNEGDQSNITRDILSEALSSCLCAIPEFAEYCLPLVIEKIESNLKVAKMDSLKLLQDSIVIFGINGFKPFITELWVSLKEAAMSGDPELKVLALLVITNIMQIISEDKPLCTKIIQRIIDDTKWTLSNVQLSSYWSSERILEAVAKANSDNCEKILKFVIPLCLGQYAAKTSSEEKVIILKTLSNFLTIASEFNINVQNIPELSWTTIPVLLTKDINSDDYDIKIESLNCFNAQIMYINSVHRDTLYKNICDFIETGNDILKKTSFTLLENFAKIYPGEILDFIVERFPIDTDDIKSDLFQQRLKALFIIAKESKIGHILLPRLVELTVTSSDLNDVALDQLNNLLHLKNTNFDIHRFLHENDTIDKLLTINIEASDNKLTLISSICRSIIRKLTIEEQQHLFNKNVNTLKNNLSDDSALFIEALIIPLNEKVICSIDVCLYFDKLTKLALESCNSKTRLAACKLISVLIHKLSKTDFIEKYIIPLRQNLVDILKNNEFSESQNAAVILHTWITKSFVIGGIGNFTRECIIDQIDFLRHHQVGEIVAEEFRTLIDKNEDTLTKENGCKIMFLYQQRVFENLLIENVFDGAERRNFLIAFTTALEEVPKQLLFMHIQSIVPILAESLTLYESKLLLPILRTLKLFLQEKHVIFIEEAKRIIPNILQLTSHKEMKIRIAAVECLNNYCNYSSIAVYSFKPEVLDKLETTIDDHKRLVRKIAAITRSRWFLYEQPIP